MTYALKTGNAKFLMTAASSLDVAIAAAEKAGVPKRHVFLLEGEAEGHLTVHDLIKIGRERETVPAFKIPEGKTNGDVCGYLSFSSGTTGLPKAVMLSHQNVIAQCLQVQFSAPPDSKAALAVLPLFHSEFS
jgi:4-coumarate--CoA ligase